MKSVYVGEDSAVERTLLEALVSSLPNVSYKIFSNGLDLWFETLAHPPDLVIVDLLLSSLTGFDFCFLLRHHQSLKVSPKVVAVSSMGLQAGQEVQALGADYFLPKPIAPDESLRLFRALLGLHEYENSIPI